MVKIGARTNHSRQNHRLHPNNWENKLNLEKSLYRNKKNLGNIYTDRVINLQNLFPIYRELHMKAVTIRQIRR